ncbi:shikimate dehydrogenase [Enterovirga aerilata]|uniref:Shikimate dehydrogenase (NADP(+)) n=1 Tax=Enterovirga aerilata TaxID=2730920 RepID=A0A849ICH9_9HYPH|nr:shikimate dehydrogenase [Enterovirga sp. DB1703]NNM73687.1 shikimate dehydrogenase [Enterovirga sp. DB1703]
MIRRAFVIGHPVGHSRSPLIHGHWLARYGIAGSYERVEVPPEDLAPFLSRVETDGWVGGNVTVPHKEAACRLVGETTARARRLGSVNTLWLADGRLHGDTTDGEGFLASLADAVGPCWMDEVGTVLILGAGGAARAIVGALLDAGANRIVLANRTAARACGLASLAPSAIEAVPWEAIPNVLPRANLLVNTTQCGMKGQPRLELDLARLAEEAIVADIVYVPLETELLASARARGLRTVDGLGMLLHQAVPGFERWFGVRPDVTPELRAVVEADIRKTA